MSCQWFRSQGPHRCHTGLAQKPAREPGPPPRAPDLPPQPHMGSTTVLSCCQRPYNQQRWTGQAVGMTPSRQGCGQLPSVPELCPDGSSAGTNQPIPSPVHCAGQVTIFLFVLRLVTRTWGQDWAVATPGWLQSSSTLSTPFLFPKPFWNIPGWPPLGAAQKRPPK